LLFFLLFPQGICSLVGRGFSRAKIGATSFGLQPLRAFFRRGWPIQARFWLEWGNLPSVIPEGYLLFGDRKQRAKR
jgi:hypothetical protein